LLGISFRPMWINM